MGRQPACSPDRRILFEIRVDKSWQESNEIRIPFDLDKHIHGPIYAETFHFLRDFIVIVIMSQKLISEQCDTFSLKPARVLHQPQKLFYTIIEWDSIKCNNSAY
jgi:hypothetical protein